MIAMIALRNGMYGRLSPSAAIIPSVVARRCSNNSDKQTVLCASYPSVTTNSRDTRIRTITNQHFVPAQRVRFGFECKHLQK